MKKEITYWKGINLGPQRKEWMKNHLRLEEIKPSPSETTEEKLHILLEQYQFKYKWYPDGESKFVMNQKFVNDIVKLFNPPNKD